MMLAARELRADWPNTNISKWVQYPDRRGLDVLAARPAAGALPIVLADDFWCRKPGPITDIHLWVSWFGNAPTWNVPIILSIWSDVPALTNGPNVIPSHPGSLLWKQTFAPGEYTGRVVGTGDEQFWNPEPPPLGTLMGPDQQIWQYNFYPANPFIQQGTATAPIVYWLAMSAGTNMVALGWKTATNHWNDDAVFGHANVDGTPIGDWQELRDPRTPANPRSLDLAFALTTGRQATNPPPPNKWAQYPDRQGGLDVNNTFPNIVADDFLCTEAGTITNIQLWASFKNNLTPNNNAGFGLAFWTDVPAGTAGTGNNVFSHPGQLVCSNWFGPGEYTVTPDGVGDEMFYDPSTGEMTPETQIWRYEFRPKDPCCQKGSTNSPRVYWLSVYSQQPTGWFVGWKTSTNHWNDDGVFGHMTAAGGAVGDWKELRDPRTGQSLDLAFVLQNGPPTRDCDPQVTPQPKFIQWPDVSTNGLDVRATFTNILADDFLCRRPGPVNAVTIWTSWLNDLVDTNAIFQLGLWTDVPAQPGTTNNFSHPGQLLCSQIFAPPQATGWPLRYAYRPAASNLQERFYDPNLPDAVSLIGADTMIWRYDFYPRGNCWYQDGNAAQPKIYWLSVTALTDTNKYLFGWKTSTNHWNDDGVFGHVNSSGIALNDWKDLHDPRSGRSLDLSFSVRTLPVVGINKDLKNTTTVTANGLRIVVAGIHEITWHYDNGWPIFNVSYSGGNTVLEWTGTTVAPGAITHVGFEMSGTSISIVSMSWLAGGAVVSIPPVQVNMHMWGNGTSLSLNNNLAAAPVVPLGGTIEFHALPVPLDQMLPSSNRNPIAVATLPIQPAPLMPGQPLRIPLPPAPSSANFVVITLNLADVQGQAATMDFLMLPLDRALRPNIEPGRVVGNFFDITFDVLPGRLYRVRESPTLSANSFFDVFTDLSLEEGGQMHLQLPVSGAQKFYQISMDPE